VDQHGFHFKDEMDLGEKNWQNDFLQKGIAMSYPLPQVDGYDHKE